MADVDWRIHALVIGLQLRALTPPNVTIANLLRQKHGAGITSPRPSARGRGKGYFPPRA
jgi:hypothetical protein